MRRRRLAVTILALLLLAAGGVAAAMVVPRWGAVRFLLALEAIDEHADGSVPADWKRLGEEARVGVARAWYAPADDGGTDAPVMVLVHGATVQGIDDGRLIGLVLAFRAAGFRVVVPEVRGLVRMGAIDREERALAAFLAAMSEGRVTGVPETRYGVFALSVGAPFALRACAMHRAAGREGPSAICALGSPHDVRRIAKAWFTPVEESSSTASDEEKALAHDASAFARNLVARWALEGAVPAEDRARLRAWLEEGWKPRPAPEDLATERGRAVAAAVLSGAPPGDPTLEALLTEAEEAFSVVSPATWEEELSGLRDVPVFLIHGVGDVLVPISEMPLLAAALERHTRVRTLESQLVAHTTVGGEGAWPHVLFHDAFFDAVRAR
jgi:pimeloyl-ACP methyl ester carboxylesterase